MEFRAIPVTQSIGAKSIDQLLPDWEQDIARRTSKKSAKACRYAIRPFFTWWDEFGPSYDWELTEESLLDFHSWLRNEFINARGKQPTHNGQANCLTRLRSLFRWAAKTGRADIDISGWVPTLSMKPKRSRLLSVDALYKLLEGASAGDNPVRDRAIIGLMAGTGARSIEVFNARLDPGYLEIRADKSGGVFYEVTKMDRPRVSVFGSHTGKLVESWMDHCGRDTGPIWGNNLKSPKMLYEVVSRCAQRAQLGQVGPHDIRKLFCSHWYREYPHGDERAQYFLGLQVGHSSGTNTTQRHYVDTVVDDLLPFYVSPLETPDFANFIESVI